MQKRQINMRHFGMAAIVARRIYSPLRSARSDGIARYVASNNANKPTIIIGRDPRYMRRDLRRHRSRDPSPRTESLRW